MGGKHLAYQGCLFRLQMGREAGERRGRHGRSGVVRLEREPDGHPTGALGVRDRVGDAVGHAWQGAIGLVCAKGLGLSSVRGEEYLLK